MLVNRGSRRRMRPEYPRKCRWFGHRKQRRYITEMGHRRYYRDCSRFGCFWLES